MILLLIFIIASIVLSIWMIKDRFENPVSSLSGIVVDFVTIVLSIIVFITTLEIPKDKIEWDTLYHNLEKRIEIDSPTDVNLYSAITNWNTKYASYKYKSESKCISCFYPKQVIADVDIINYEIP